MNIRTSIVSLALFAGLASVLAPTPAHACGGTFCDGSVVNPMAVDQTGEDILFIREGDEIEVHVRIEYTGEATRFAWLVPVQALPEISVGSETLFAALSQATVPTWQVKRSYDCDSDNPNLGGGFGFVPSVDFAGEPPDVVYEEVVGAFEVVVLQGGTAAEVIDFLQTNEYQQDPASEPILQEYLDEGFLLVAVKLAAGASVEAIHPLVFRMNASEPCVPIRLTRIAAKDDLEIRAYFLGQARWAPSNYAHVVLNQLAYDWLAPTPTSFVELLSLAVDEAGGRAFATDYAGPSDIVVTDGVYSPTWDENAYVDVDPIAAMELIFDQGLWGHPMLAPLLLEFIPPPDGLEPNQFWAHLDDYADQIDQAAWSGPDFAAALAERIIDPGIHGLDLLEAWPTLTRLHTTMSPAEMTLDPTFHANPDLPQVGGSKVAISRVYCGGDELISLFGIEPDPMAETQVCVSESSVWPMIEGMPKALRIEQIPMAGPAQVTLDNSATALGLLATQQATVTCESNQAGDGDGDGSTSSGDEVADESSSGPTYDLPYDTTCGCATTREQAPLAIGLGLVVLGSIAPRRRRA